MGPPFAVRQAQGRLLLCGKRAIFLPAIYRAADACFYPPFEPRDGARYALPAPPFYDKSMRNFFPLIPKDDIFRLRPFRQSRKGILTQKGKPDGLAFFGYIGGKDHSTRRTVCSRSREEKEAMMEAMALTRLSASSTKTTHRMAPRSFMP